jgi:hypothetical protein
MNEFFVWLLSISELALAVVVFIVLTLACEIGFRVGRSRGAKLPEKDRDNSVTATLTAGMLGLLAFILGLTINFAQNRFEARRDLVVVEANTIGTAWLRARLVGGPEGPAIADLIREYAQTRLAFTRENLNGHEAALSKRTSEEESEIWALMTQVAQKAPTPITATLVTALNEMFDSAQSQRFAFIGQAPSAMLDMLMAGSIIAIGAMGFEMGLRRLRQPVLTSLLLLMWTGGMVITVDLSRARVGTVRVDPSPLQWTLQEITPPGPSIPAAAH